MSFDSSDDDFEAISKLNQNKISRKMENMGYKDGMHDGQESQFQNGFDVGYENGFKHGFLLGKYKGSLAANQNDKSNDETKNPANDLILGRASRGHCVICTDNSLKDQSISNIVEKQTNHMKNIQTTLESRYGSK